MERTQPTLTPTMPLRDFVAEAWPVLEPATPYRGNWHIDAISDLLTAVTQRQVGSAIINIPPRCMKSTLVSVMWPAWEWTMMPSLRYLSASYALGLAIRDTGAMRHLVMSPWYRNRWGDRVTLARDQHAKSRFRNTAMGQRLATSVGAGGTGEGGDRITIDDPINALDAHSRVKREEVITWFSGTMSTRTNNAAAPTIVVVMQRLHENDLTGYLIEQMQQGGAQFEHLVLPMRYEDARMHVAPDCAWRDRRSEPGSLLWPARFPEPVVAALEVTLGNEAAGQLQQRPTQIGGAIFLDAWWDGKNRYDLDAPPPVRVIERYLFLDTALKEGEANDYSACVLFELLADYRVRARPLWHKRLPFHLLIDAITQTAEDINDRLLRDIVIEDKVSGISAVQSLRARGPAWLRPHIRAWLPVRSKEYRWQHASNYCAGDCIELPEDGDPRVPELPVLLYQLTHVPAVEHDDYADAFAMGILYLELKIKRGLERRLRRVA